MTTASTKQHEKLSNPPLVHATRLRAQAKSLLPFWVTCGLLLITSHYQLWGRLNIAYKTLSILSVVLMPFVPGFPRFLSNKIVLGLLTFLGVITTNVALNRYITPGVLFDTDGPVIVTIRCLPLMFCGYTLARHPAYEKRFLWVIILFYALLAVPDAIGFNSAASQGFNRIAQASYRYGVDSAAQASEYIHTYIYFGPLLLFLSALAMRLYATTTRRQLVILVASQLLFLQVALFSGFAAVIILAVAALAILPFIAPTRQKALQRVAILLIAVMSLAAIETIRIGFVSQSGRGAVSTAFKKISTAMDDSDAASLEVASSGRYGLFLKSIDTFKKNPLFGHGLETQSDAAIGGHSFLVDTAAIFGLMGLVPIAFVLFAPLWGLVNFLWSRSYDWRLASSISVATLLCLGNILNPYLLNMLSLSFFEFLGLGFCLADLERASSSTTIQRQGLDPASRYRPNFSSPSFQNPAHACSRSVGL